jgi:heterodisulfide reductase subunit C
LSASHSAAHAGPFQHNPFLAEVAKAAVGDSRLEHCIQCGTCGGSCPSAQDMDHSPRQIFAMIKAGMRKEVLESSTPWVCVSCYNCVVRCPQKVKITDLMYTLKNMAVKAKMYKDTTAPEFSQTFVVMVENFGRSFELGLATRYFLRYQPMRLPGMAPLGLGMLSKKRMDFRPHRIQGMAQLKAILDCARELEETP